MPTTVNGIGTKYQGRSNLLVRTGQCGSCGRVGKLSSYDTRLCFCLVFIPLIPLTRKRIIDDCAICRRHYAVDYDKFLAARQSSFDQGREEFTKNPSVEAAATLHRDMLMLNARDDARSFREQAMNVFRNDAALHAALALQLEEVGDSETAAPLFARAHTLDPQLPEARDGLAGRRIVEGRLDEARALVNFLEKPGAGQTYRLGRLRQLAQAYQQVGRHDEAIALAGHLLRETPDVAEHRDFRRLVRTSETATNRFDSMLPSDSAWLALFNFSSPRLSSGVRWAFFLSVAALFVAGGLAAFNDYYRRHRAVIVRNEFGPAAEVKIDGVAVPNASQARLILPEGSHHVSVTGNINEEFDLPMQTGYWTRWSNSPQWIVNVGGASQVMFITMYYAKNPRPEEYELHVGERVFFAPDVDYPFTTPPNSIDLQHENSEVKKTRLSIAQEKPEDVFAYALRSLSAEAAFTYAESQLLLQPANSALLKDYAAAATAQSQSERAKTFLKGHIGKRPILVQWHRAYQELHATAAEHMALIKDYDELLKAEPNDAALLYLRGRISGYQSEAKTFFNRSIAADPQFSWPWSALAYQSLTNGEWADCKRLLQEATRRKHEDDLSGLLHYAQLGLGESPALEAEYRQKLAGAAPGEELQTVVLLTSLLIARGNGRAADRVFTEWEAKLPAADRGTPQLEGFHRSLQLLSGDFAAIDNYVQLGFGDPSIKFHWLLAKNRPAEAEQDSALAVTLQNPWNALCLSLAYDLAENRAAAATWREKACDSLTNSGFDEVHAAELLRAAVPPTPAELGEIGLLPTEKSLLAAGLAMRFPQQHRELSAIAKRLDVQPVYFSLIVRKVIEHRPLVPN